MKKFNKFDTQLGESVLVLTDKAKLSLYKKSQKSGISTDILEEVYRRGVITWVEEFGGSPEQFGFDRVNSFIAGGFAVELDEDLKQACWKGYKAVGMKKKNGKTVPNCVPVKEDERQEAHSTDPDKSASRFDGSDELVNIYKETTPGQVVKRVVKESAAWKRKEGKNPEGGLNQKGVESYRRENPGSKLKMAVTTPPSKLDPDSKAAKRRKSFCARMGGMPGPMKDEKGRPTRKALSLRKWNCEETEINETSEKLRMAYTNKAMKATREKEKKPGEHFKREEGIHRAARLSIAAKKKEVKEDVATATTAPAPTAASMGPSKLGRSARVELSRRTAPGGEGLRRVGSYEYSNVSKTNLSGRRMTSGSTSVTAKTLTPQRASVSQPAPKTASAPTSAPKPSASFGSSSRPTTVSATSGGMEKSGGYKISSGMSDAGKAKVKPTAPVEIPAAAAKKGLGTILGRVAKVATGPAATAAMTVMEPTPAGEKKSEFQRQADVAKGISYKAQGRSVSDYEKQVLTPKTYDKPEAPKAANPVVNAPTPPERPKYFSRGQAFSAARSEVGGSKGKFSYGGKDYQTNVKGEKYAPASKLKTTSVKEELSVPKGTTGKRETVSTPMVAVRMASGKVEKHPPGKSGSSGGGDE